MVGFVDKLEEVLSSMGSKDARESAKRARELQPLIRKALLLGLEEAATIVRLQAEDYRGKGQLAESDVCAAVEKQIHARISELEEEEE